jgi:hypothetical protein
MPITVILVDADTIDLTVNYVEPTQSSDGTPLTDLASTTVEMSEDGIAWVQLEVVPASQPGGGGNQDKAYPGRNISNMTPKIYVRVFATDLNNNAGVPDQREFDLDRLAPAAPTL